MSAPLIQKPGVGTSNWHPIFYQMVDAINDLDERIRDQAGSALLAGSGISITPNDAGDTIIISATGGGGSGLDAEGVMDLLGTTGLVAGNSNLLIAYDDVAGTITLTAQTSSETVRDTMGTASKPTAGIIPVYDDAADTFKWQNRAFGSIPSEHGVENWTIHPDQAGSSSAVVAGTVYLMRFHAFEADTINTILMRCNTAGATVTNGFVGLYDMAGNRLGQSAAQTTAWQSTGEKNTALTAGVAVTADTDYVGALLVGGAGTPPQFARGSASQLSNIGIALPNFRVATFGTGLTALPATIDFNTAVNNTGLIQYFMGFKT